MGQEAQSTIDVLGTQHFELDALYTVLSRTQTRIQSTESRTLKPIITTFAFHGLTVHRCKLSKKRNTIMAKKKSQHESSQMADESTSFEDALSRLEDTVARLETGNIPLADALAQYEQGVRYLKHCYGLLERAELKIEQLTGIDADGNPITEVFEHRATSTSDSSNTSGRKRGVKRHSDSTSKTDS